MIRDSIAVAQSEGYAGDFEFIYQDTKCNTKDAVSGTQSLKALHPSMHMFIVGCDNDMKAMYPLLDARDDLTFMAGLSGADLYESGFPTINLAYRLEAEATEAAKFASERLGVKTLGIITDNGTFGGTLNDSATEYFNGVGGRTISEKIKYNEPSPETSVLKILAGKPDAVYMQNDIPAMSAILKRLNQMGYKGDRIAYYGGRDQSLIDTAGKAGEGLYVPWVVSDITNSTRQNFEAKFKETYGKDPFVTAYFVYDGLMLLDEAEKSCGTDVRCIEKYFYDKDDFVGTLGKVRYQPSGEVERDFYFQQIRDGKFVEVE